MALVKFTNGQRNGALKSPYSDLFSSFFNADQYLSKSLVNRMPAVNVSEDEKGFLVELAAPGLKKDDFKINVEKDQLTVSAGQKNEASENVAEKNYNRREFSYTSFSKTFTLPDSVDQSKIDAQYADGILAISVAKKEEAQVQAREISIK